MYFLKTELNRFFLQSTLLISYLFNFLLASDSNYSILYYVVLKSVDFLAREF